MSTFFVISLPQKIGPQSFFWHILCLFLGTSQGASTKKRKSTKSQYLWEGRRATRSNQKMFWLKNSMNKKSIIHLVTKTNEDATKVLFSCSMFAVKLCDKRALFIFCKYIFITSQLMRKVYSYLYLSMNESAMMKCQRQINIEIKESP